MIVRRGVVARMQESRLRLKVSADTWAFIHDCGNQAAWAAVAASVLLFLYAVVYAFPNARRIALQQQWEVVEQENRAFCEKHGMPYGTREHTVCAEDLMDIRANERQRTLDELGIF